MFQQFMGSKHPVSWYKCPYCQAVFDVPAAKPPCPRCGTRCNWTNEIAPLDPRKPANEQVPELGLASPESKYPLSRRSFLKYAVSAAALVPAAKHFLPPENGWPSASYAFRHDDWQRFETDYARARSYKRYSWTDPIAFYGTSDAYQEAGRLYLEDLSKSLAKTRNEAFDKFLTSNPQWLLKS